MGAGSLPAIRRLSGRERLGLLAIGIIGGGIPFALFFEGLALSSSPAAAVIHKTLFLWVAVLAVPFLGERFGLLPIAALVLLLTGTVMLAPAGLIQRPRPHDPCGHLVLGRRSRHRPLAAARTRPGLLRRQPA